ncbi:MAG: SH3 domain-containing protein [Anaerolineae bacterium]|nr:SH3 domain-containing protein [Anaerolineae bacterium]
MTQTHIDLRHRIVPVFVMMLLISILASGWGIAQAQTACPAPENLPPRLAIGSWGRVSPEPGPANNVRAQPGRAGERVGELAAGDVFAVVDGPRCADGYVWWQVQSGDLIGWTAEGTDGEYWLEPLAALLLPDDNSMPPVCATPPEDYSRVTIGNAVLNARTLAMLDHAAAIYQALGGTTVDFHYAITQGSYTGGYVAASFGTHDGGGALDLSVRSREDFSLLEEDIPVMLEALRLAGFAAWLRQANQLEPGSPIHIHAVAIGDAELSTAARAQVDGTFGYLRGYDGIPYTDGIPKPDDSGEMVICGWMIDQGFNDLRDRSNVTSGG